MKKIILMLIVVLVVCSSSQGQNIPEYNKNRAFVQDFANILSEEEEVALNNELAKFEKQTSNEIVVCTQDDLQDYEISDYANKMFNTWGIGKKGVDNGLLIIISPKNRKTRFEVGYGLEPYLTDGQTKHIQDEYFKPNFRKGDYYKGINEAVGKTMTVLTPVNPEIIEQNKVQKQKENEQAMASLWSFLVGLFWVVLIGAIIILIVKYIVHKKQERERIAEEKRREERRKKDEAERKIQEELTRLEQIKTLKKTIVDTISAIQQSKNKDFKKYKNGYYLTDSEIKRYNEHLNEFEGFHWDSESEDIKTLSKVSSSLISFLANARTIESEIKKSSSFRDKILNTATDFEKEKNKLRKTYEENLAQNHALHTKYFKIFTPMLDNIGTWWKELESQGDIKYKILKISNLETINAESEQRFYKLEENSFGLIRRIKGYYDSILTTQQKVLSAERIVSEITFDSLDRLRSKAASYKHKAHVNRSTHSLFDTAENNLVNLQGDKNLSKDVLKHADLLVDAKKQFDSYISTAERDIKKQKEDEEEEERKEKKRKQDKKDQEAKNRSDYRTSTYVSSFDNTSSNSSSSGFDFGGGGSGGGGSDSNW